MTGAGEIEKLEEALESDDAELFFDSNRVK